MPYFGKLFKKPVKFAYKRLNLFTACLMFDFILTIGGADSLTMKLRHKTLAYVDRRCELYYQQLKDEQRAHMAASSVPR